MYKQVEKEIEEYIANNGKANLDEKIYEICKTQPDYVSRNLLLKYVWDVQNPISFAENMIESIFDEQTKMQTIFLLISGLEVLDEEKVNFLESLVSLNTNNIKTILKAGLELNISDIFHFEHNELNDAYSFSVTQFYTILANEIINSIENDRKMDMRFLKNIRDIFRKNSNLLNFNGVIEPITSKRYFEDKKSQKNVDYKVLEKEYYDRRWKSALSNKEKQSIICERYLNVVPDEAEELINKIYFSKGKDDFKDFKTLRAIIESEEYDELYKSLNSSLRKLYRNLEFEYKVYCCNDIANSLEKYENKSKRVRKTDVDVYSLTNQDFTLLIHRTNAFTNRSVDADVNFDKMSIEDGRAIISCSLITDLYLGKVMEDEEDGGVYFGFNSIKANDIVDMGTKDIFSSEIIGNKVPTSSYGNNFYDSENLILNTFDQYNEVCIFREDQETGVRLKPDYIVCFDRVNDYSKEIAKKRNIPIYFINTSATYANGREKLRAMVRDDKNFQNFDDNINLLKRLISFAYSAITREKSVLDKNLLYDFIVKTRQSKKFSRNYIEKITRYAVRLNQNLGFQSGYDPDKITDIFEQELN